MEKEFDVVKAAKAQQEYCDRTGAPHFAPKSGICWNCHQNIYEAVEHTVRDYQTSDITTYITGIDVEKAGSELVTGCPHCCRSYCD